MTEVLAASGSARMAGVRELAVDVHDLVKRFGDFEAVSGVSFSVAKGEVFAFLGPNGAGKSTTIKMLCTLARPTSGHATVAGFDVTTHAKAVRRHIGLVFQEQTLDEQLTANENLRFHAVLYRVPRSEASRGFDTCWSSSTSPSVGTISYPRSLEAWPAGSRSPARCCTRPTCCSSTSPHSVSTPKPVH